MGCVNQGICAFNLNCLFCGHKIVRNIPLLFLKIFSVSLVISLLLFLSLVICVFFFFPSHQFCEGFIHFADLLK